MIEFQSQFLYLDEKRRQKAISILFESTPVRSTSMVIDSKQPESATSTEEADSSSFQTKEEVLKIKPSQLPLMNQVRN